MKVNKKTGKIKVREHDLQKSAEQLLGIVLDGWYEHFSPFFKQNKGIPDIIGWHNVQTEKGLLQKFFYIELKIGNKKPTLAQIEYMKKLSLCGAIGCVAYNMEDVKSFLKNELDININ